jgi:hypothetical protein
MTRLLFALGCSALLAGCDGTLPTSPSRLPLGTPPIAGKPLPPPFAFKEPFTLLTIGASIERTVVKEANPDCPDVPGFGCQFFRVVPEADGNLDIDVSWVLESQPNQGLDLTIEDEDGTQFWANEFRPGHVGVYGPVLAGATYQVTVWYTFPGLEFALGSSLVPR